MQNRYSSYGIIFLVFVSLFFVLTESKAFGGSKGSGGFRGTAKGPGSFGGPSSFNRQSGYGSNMVKSSGGGFKKAAVSFAAGAAGGVAAYSLMRMMSGSGYRAGYYEPGYGRGETCVNNENLNGTVFGSFRCPLNGFPYEAKYCCGEYGHQFCCLPDERRGLSRGASMMIWITVILVVLLLIALFWTRRQRRKQKDVIMVPTEIPINEPQAPPYYHPAAPPMGYPPAQSYPNIYNPYQPAPPQGAMPYPPQQPFHNPYQTAPGY